MSFCFPLSFLLSFKNFVSLFACTHNEVNSKLLANRVTLLSSHSGAYVFHQLHLPGEVSQSIPTCFRWDWVVSAPGARCCPGLLGCGPRGPCWFSAAWGLQLPARHPPPHPLSSSFLAFSSVVLEHILQWRLRKDLWDVCPSFETMPS